MKNLYIITYEINKNKDHSLLYDTIKNYRTWWHYLDSAWIIKTSETAQEIADKITPYIDGKEDSFLVVKLDANSRQGLLPNKAWEWLKRNTS